MKSNIKSWDRIYRNWKKSGLTRTEYCSQNNLSKSTFYYWQKRIRLLDEKPNNSHKTMEMVKLPINLSGSKERCFTLEFPGDYKLQIPQGSSSQELKQIITDLKDILK